MMANAALPCWVESGGQETQEEEERVWSPVESPPLFLDFCYAPGPSRIPGCGLGCL